MNNKKPIILLGILLASILLAFTRIVLALQSTVDWSPTFHHDLNHTGYSTSTGPLTNQTLWSYPTDNSVEYTSPAIVNGAVYVGSDDNYMYAFGSIEVSPLSPPLHSPTIPELIPTTIIIVLILTTTLVLLKRDVKTKN